MHLCYEFGGLYATIFQQRKRFENRGFEREAAVLFWSLGRMENLYGYYERSLETAKQIDLPEHAPWKLLIEIDSASLRVRAILAESSEKIEEIKKTLDRQISEWKSEIEFWEPIMQYIGDGVRIRSFEKQTHKPFSARRMAMLMIAEMQEELEIYGLVSREEIETNTDIAILAYDEIPTEAETCEQADEIEWRICISLLENGRYDLVSIYMKQNFANPAAMKTRLIQQQAEDMADIFRTSGEKENDLRDAGFRHLVFHSEIVENFPTAYSNCRNNPKKWPKPIDEGSPFFRLMQELKPLDHL